MAETTTTAAIVRGGVVENVIVYDPNANWSPPEGTTLVVLEPEKPAGIGWAHDEEKQEFVAPPAPEPVVEQPVVIDDATIQDLRQQVIDLAAKIEVAQQGVDAAQAADVVIPTVEVVK